MKSKIKTAVIGVGNMGKNHARVYSEISDIVAVADINVEIGKLVAAKYHTKYYQDYRKMLDNEKIDAVSVAVPTKFHKEVTINCLRKKIPTLVEKPIAETISDAEEMVKTAERNRVFLMVGHIERFNPAVVRAKKLIDQNRFGKIISLLAIRVGISPPETPNLDVALDLAIHDLDVFNYLLNEYPLEKKIMKNKIFNHNQADSASLLLRYKNTVGMIQTNWITPIKMRRLYITGTDGFAELDYISQKLVLYDKVINKKTVGDFFELVSLSKVAKKDIYISRKEPLKQELLFFLENLDNLKVTNISQEAYKALEILLET